MSDFLCSHFLCRFFAESMDVFATDREPMMTFRAPTLDTAQSRANEKIQAMSAVWIRKWTTYRDRVSGQWWHSRPFVVAGRNPDTENGVVFITPVFAHDTEDSPNLPGGAGGSGGDYAY